ncbi:MAG TPA: DedA family protein, partial [Gemmatales bacterium]|nr:DedA family protein [Gemmatales bacterium]
NKKHLLYAQAFYERWGSFTIVMCRFVPIVRTFGPFVAGIGKMQYRKFAIFNVGGAFFWVISLTMAGYWFGGLPFVKKNFSWVVLAIVLISVLPMVITLWMERRKLKRMARANVV